MRDIKFRAWNGKVMSYDVNVYSDGTVGDYWWGADVIFEDYLKHSFSEGNLMQYTGLKDKNGVEIYEGDLVNYDGYLGYVGFDNGVYIFYEIKPLKNYDEYQIELHEIVIEEQMNTEVIGNIYENPELLEGI